MKQRATQLGNVLLINADNAEVDLTRLPKFNAVISDPPYGIGHFKGPSGGNGAYAQGKRSRRNSTRVQGDAAPFDPAWVCALSDDVALFGANHYARRLPEGGRWLAWDKLAGREPWDSFSDVEFIWHSRPGKSAIVSWLWKGIACRKEGEDQGKRYHPTQKPIYVMRWLIEQLGRPPVVFDPYLGSGSTAVACVREGLGCVGIELDPAHYDVAVERVRRERQRAST